MKKKKKEGRFIRGFLLHITHYDPDWNPKKASERPFDLWTAVDILEAMVQAKMNTLVVDIEDGVRYLSHPELARRYSVPMRQLEELCRAARRRGIDAVPKLNFSKSGRNEHDKWMRPHWDPVNWLKNTDDYWKTAADVIDECVAACRPERYFHIGMDEDHYRSLPQYVEAVKRLHAIVKKYGLRTIIWNDSCYAKDNVVAQVHAHKILAAEPLLPKDIVHILWDYECAHGDCVKRLAEAGREVWGASGASAKNIRDWRRMLLTHGGSGLLMTQWVKCNRANRTRLLKAIEVLGMEYT